MAGCTGRWDAFQVKAMSRQAESSLLVIERTAVPLGRRPGLRCVALLTGGVEHAAMDIRLHMAVLAALKCPFKLSVFMAGSTFNLCVLSIQGKARILVVE